MKDWRWVLALEGKIVASNPRFFTEPSSLFLDSIKQSRLDPDTIMDLVTLPPLKAHWERRHRLTPQAFQEVDWKRVGEIMASLPSGLQRWTTKHAVGMCGVGKWKVRWKYSSVDQCPRCGEPEDHQHITRCSAPTATSEWNDRIANFQTWMSSQQTAPAIQIALLRFLKLVRDPSFINSNPIPSPDPTLLHTAMESQKIIGVQCLLEGLLSHHWAPLQTAHFC